MEEQKVPMNHIQYIHIEHDSTYYENKTIGSKSTEEITCVEAAASLLEDENGD